MSQRTKSKDRCARCRIRRVLCVCSLIPCFDLETKVIVLIHNRETKRPTNTGLLATLALSNSEMRVRGRHREPMDQTGLIEQGRQSLLLYPDEKAQELTPELKKYFGKPLTLIVPDGSWRQAAKVGFRERALSAIPRVKISTGLPTQYRLRRESKENGLATIEAIARALGILETREVQESLENLFRAFVERTLWSRAKILAQDCQTGIPPKALKNQ